MSASPPLASALGPLVEMTRAGVAAPDLGVLSPERNIRLMLLDTALETLPFLDGWGGWGLVDVPFEDERGFTVLADEAPEELLRAGCDILGLLSDPSSSSADDESSRTCAESPGFAAAVEALLLEMGGCMELEGLVSETRVVADQEGVEW